MNIFEILESEDPVLGLDDEVLTRIGGTVVEEYDIDETSMGEWLDANEQAMGLVEQVYEKKSTPWENAANTHYPLILDATVKFAAEAYPAFVKRGEAAQAKVYGDETPVKLARASRVSRWQNHYLFNVMKAWEEDVDRMLHVVPVLGCVHKKVFHDGKKCRSVLKIDGIVVNQNARSTEEAPRVSEHFELYGWEAESKARRGLWRRIEGVGRNEDDESPDTDEVRWYIEQLRMEDLDDDGMPEPYVVTVHRETRQVVRIEPNYRIGDVEWEIVNDEENPRRPAHIEPRCHYIKYEFMPSLDGTYWGWGWGRILGPLNENVNTIVNQLLDAGTLANLQGGWIDSRIRLPKGEQSFVPGEWKTAHTVGMNLSEGIMPLPVRDPSATMFALLEMLTDATKQLSSVTEVLGGDQPHANMASSTVMALIERGLKTFGSIYVRIWRSQATEFEKLAALMQQYTNVAEYNEFFDGGQVDEQTGEQIVFDPSADFNLEDLDVRPTANPEFSSKVQQLAQAQAAMEGLQAGLPGVDGVAVSRLFYQAIAPELVDTLVPEEPKMTPQQMMEQLELEKQKLIGDAEVREAEAKAQTAEANKEKAAIEFQLLLEKAPTEVIKAVEAAKAAVEKTETARFNADTAEANAAKARVEVVKAAQTPATTSSE